MFIRDMKENDLAAVLEIESAAQFHPWTQQNFIECLKPGFLSIVASGVPDRADKNVCDERVIGFALLSIQVVEMELLNIAVAAEYRGRGIAQDLLLALKGRVTTLAPAEQSIFLEVRESNFSAINLYKKFGFIQTGKRKNYYPTADGREAALLFKLAF